jgi:hypothetical protein
VGLETALVTHVIATDPFMKNISANILQRDSYIICSARFWRAYISLELRMGKLKKE